MIFSDGNTVIFISSITDTHRILFREKTEERRRKEREFLEKIGNNVRTDITKGNVSYLCEGNRQIYWTKGECIFADWAISGVLMDSFKKAEGKWKTILGEIDDFYGGINVNKYLWEKNSW